ncbi:MAG: hypothetical protein NUV55_09220 [Sulfuricaulis sp.]|uniref:hypothetical protein n=1 Tax=Sulfuricaulis sp. TaxID=2003553 RepID=UPI0025DA3963|nr:hypothetical protein [Sulfuricaulis sp.]MCR4347363.1 hypothetical protein [Sulfuricaulis sp.]
MSGRYKEHLWACVVALALVVVTSVRAAERVANSKTADSLQQMMMSYKPELKQKVMQLSPEMRATIKKLHDSHTRKSQQLTLRQIMHEILSDYQSIAAGIATDNAEQAADSARRLANHRIPKGGLFPYFPLDMVNDADMSVLPIMNNAVEGSALKLATAAEKGDMATAAARLSDIMTGCVACHQKFRSSPPGATTLLLYTSRK